MKNAKKIAMIISGLRYEGQTKTVQGVLSGARSYGLEVYIFTCDNNWERIRDAKGVLPLFIPDDYDGIIFHGDTIEGEKLVDSLVEEIVGSGVPAVTLKDPHEGMTLMGMDNFKGIYEIVRHLTEVHGAKTINFIAGAPESVDAAERETAFRGAMEQFGLKVEEERIKTGYFSPQGGRDAFRSWYEMRDELPLPDAIVSASDWMAVGAIEEMKKYGIDIPGDIMITGYDDTLISKVTQPPLTTVLLPNYDIGRRSVELLYELMTKGSISDNERIGNHAIFRGSCGCQTDDDSCAARDEQLRKKYYYESLHRTDYLDVLKEVQRDFAGAKDWEVFYDMVAKAAGVFDAEAFFMCTTLPHQSRSMALADFLDNEENITYTDQVMVPVALIRGQQKMFGSFRREELLSKEMKESIDGKYYVIMPLHYQHLKFGYCVVCDSEVAYESNFYSLFIQSISSAMQNLWAKSRLSKLVNILDELWIYDKLTGIMNRSGFERFASAMVEEAKREAETIFVLFADMDGLKTVNDTYGHEEGDAYIREVADILRSVHKKGELLMRYGGDEFVVMAKGYSDKEADAYIAKINKAVKYANKKDYKFPIGLSTGYVICEANDFSLEEAIEKADSRMYDAKKAGKEKRQLSDC